MTGRSSGPKGSPCCAAGGSWGSIFRGCCRYDARRGEAVIEVRLALPPHGVLLTGLEAGPDGALIEVAGRFRPPRPVSSAVIDIGGAMVAVELRYVGPLS